MLSSIRCTVQGKWLADSTWTPPHISVNPIHENRCSSGRNFSCCFCLGVSASYQLDGTDWRRTVPAMYSPGRQAPALYDCRYGNQADCVAGPASYAADIPLGAEWYADERLIICAAASSWSAISESRRGRHGRRRYRGSWTVSKGIFPEEYLPTAGSGLY